MCAEARHEVLNCVARGGAEGGDDARDNEDACACVQQLAAVSCWSHPK